MTAQRYGEGFIPLVKSWHLWALGFATLYGSIAPSLGWWPHTPPATSSILFLWVVFGIFALIDVIRGQLYVIALGNQKIVVRLTQLNWRDESIRWQEYKGEAVPESVETLYTEYKAEQRILESM